MRMDGFPFQAIDWTSIDPVEHRGDSGTAVWRTISLGSIRVRLVEYSAGYRADHWCSKGHVIHVLEGELISQQGNGKEFRLSTGMSYVVGDGSDKHRSHTPTGAKLFIVD